MADSKITGLTELASVDSSDLVAIVDDPSGTAVTKKITQDNLIPDSSVTVKGKVELATTAETTTGTDAGRAVTPDGLKDGYQGSANIDTVGTVTAGDVDAVVSSANLTTAGKIEVATGAETTTGTDAGRAVSPDGLAGSDYGKRVIGILVFDDATDTATGDGAGDVFVRIPAVMNGWNLVAVAAQVQTAGTTNTTDVQVHNVTQAADMLSTVMTIDSTETDTSTAATPAVIDAANDDVATADSIRIDVDAVSTTAAKGLYVELTFQLP